MRLELVALRTLLDTTWSHESLHSFCQSQLEAIRPWLQQFLSSGTAPPPMYKRRQRPRRFRTEELPSGARAEEQQQQHQQQQQQLVSQQRAAAASSNGEIKATLNTKRKTCEEEDTEEEEGEEEEEEEEEPDENEPLGDRRKRHRMRGSRGRRAAVGADQREGEGPVDAEENDGDGDEGGDDEGGGGLLKKLRRAREAQAARAAQFGPLGPEQEEALIAAGVRVKAMDDEFEMTAAQVWDVLRGEGVSCTLSQVKKAAAAAAQRLCQVKAAAAKHAAQQATQKGKKRAKSFAQSFAEAKMANRAKQAVSASKKGKKRARDGDNDSDDDLDAPTVVTASAGPRPIGSANKGHLLLCKMGWAGGGLGARGEGDSEPLASYMVTHSHHGGLGCSDEQAHAKKKASKGGKALVEAATPSVRHLPPPVAAGGATYGLKPLGECSSVDSAVATAARSTRWIPGGHQAEGELPAAVKQMLSAELQREVMRRHRAQLGRLERVG